MADHGYINFNTPLEYDSYQQYQQYPSEDEQVSNMENILNIIMQQFMINMQDTTQRLKNLSLQAKLMQAQLDFIQIVMDMQANNQSTHGEQEDNLIMYEKVGEIVEEGVDEIDEDTTLEECGELYITKEIETPHEEEFPQERSDTEEAETIDNQEVMLVAERKERLPSKEKSIEQKGEKVNKVEIDRVIDEIFALFNKPRLRRIWTPHQLYFKIMG